ncbi:MAG: TIGR04255 family protein [Novosphingobium sp.]
MVKKDKLKLGPPYVSPPIFECVMELRFRDLPRAKFAEKAARRIKGYYDHCQTEHLVNYEVVIDEGSVKTNASEPSPVMKLTSNDQTDTCTLANDKIYWARLAPYKGWDEFVSRIERDLDALKKDVGHRTLERIGLRFRNRIDVPVEEPKNICRYEDYMHVRIDLPDLLDPTSGYEWRVRKDFPDLGLTAVVMSGVLEPVLPKMGAFLLDIDVSSMVGESLDRADLKFRLDKMRKLKNDIFENSVTDLARESFC